MAVVDRSFPIEYGIILENKILRHLEAIVCRSTVKGSTYGKIAVYINSTVCRIIPCNMEVSVYGERATCARRNIAANIGHIATRTDNAITAYGQVSSNVQVRTGKPSGTVGRTL